MTKIIMKLVLLLDSSTVLAGTTSMNSLILSVNKMWNEKLHKIKCKIKKNIVKCFEKIVIRLSLCLPVFCHISCKHYTTASSDFLIISLCHIVILCCVECGLNK